MRPESWTNDQKQARDRLLVRGRRGESDKQKDENKQQGQVMVLSQ